MRAGRCGVRPGRWNAAARSAAARRIAALLLVLSSPAAAEESEADRERSRESMLPALLKSPSFQLSLEPVFLRESVRAAVEEATQRVEGARCQVLFQEFRDPQGRLLYERLEESRLSPAELLRTIRFVSGAGRAPCASRDVLAYSTPGLRTVAVCPESFGRVQRTNPEVASYIVIHELLHTLGLGENPPTSLEITSRVRKRCAAPAIASR
jgi:hypothetical protein